MSRLDRTPERTSQPVVSNSFLVEAVSGAKLSPVPSMQSLWLMCAAGGTGEEIPRFLPTSGVPRVGMAYSGYKQ